MTYEAIRQWCRRFGLDYARRLRHRRGRQGDTWHLDELFVKIRGRQQYPRQYENSRAEVSHQPTRQRERQMRRFKSAAHLQRFASVHGVVQNLFRVGRHLLRAAHHRLLRARSFRLWDELTCAC